ncbi:hypothetical protein F2Q70_00012027 [Brassica cretica]|uniref:Uncharacterized protein n=1 Tax=Brassica cretica TaxID=69181 RepID=A0A8S9M3S1_BRACR|nr:hypothetical protein F2Q70_00012027 [Brassica cretica]
MKEFEATHLAVPTHLRPPICVEEADGFHKRLKMIHDHVNFVDPCAISEAESPIPPDISVLQDLNIGIVDDYLPAAVFQEKSGLEDDVKKELKNAQQMLLTAIRKVRALLIAEIIDKGGEYMAEAFTKE